MDDPAQHNQTSIFDTMADHKLGSDHNPQTGTMAIDDLRQYSHAGIRVINNAIDCKHASRQSVDNSINCEQVGVGAVDEPSHCEQMGKQTVNDCNLGSGRIQRIARKQIKRSHSFQPKQDAVKTTRYRGCWSGPIHSAATTLSNTQVWGNNQTEGHKRVGSHFFRASTGKRASSASLYERIEEVLSGLGQSSPNSLASLIQTSKGIVSLATTENNDRTSNSKNSNNSDSKMDGNNSDNDDGDDKNKRGNKLSELLNRDKKFIKGTMDQQSQLIIHGADSFHGESEEQEISLNVGMSGAVCADQSVERQAENGSTSSSFSFKAITPRLANGARATADNHPNVPNVLMHPPVLASKEIKRTIQIASTYRIRKLTERRRAPESKAAVAADYKEDAQQSPCGCSSKCCPSLRHTV